MNAIGKSSVVFVTLSGLFWGGWVLGSQTPEGQEAIARAYEAYAEQQAAANENLFDSTALRAIVCGDPSVDHAEPKPCLAVIAASRGDDNRNSSAWMRSPSTWTRMLV